MTLRAAESTAGVMSMRRYVLLGCNHTGASLEEIGLARLPEDELPALLRALKLRLGAQELVYLSTCHRTEWYLAYDGELCPGRLTMALGMALEAETHGAAALPQVDRCLMLHGGEVARHLFRVASALDALMLGESQVLGQVKGAFRTATDAGVAGPRLTTLFTQAFRTAKRVRTETMLSRRPVSLVSLAERSLRARLEACPGPVAIVGAGEMANQALELVRKLAPERPVTLFNRTRDRGSSLAAQYAATYRPLGELGDGGEFTAVIAATSSELPVITPEVARRLAPALLLDFGLPPNVSGECRAVDGIELVDQEVLRGEAEANRSARAEELSKSEQIVEEQLQELSYEVMEHELSPVARRLVTTFRDLARVELARVAADSGTVPADAIEEAAERLSQRLVRVPMRGLREVAWHHSTDVLNTFLDAVQQ